MDTATAPFEAGAFTEGSSKPFGDGARDPRFDNNPPLEERVMLEFVEDLEREGITARIAELLASTERAPETIDDETAAGRIGDFIKLASDVEKRVTAAREKHNRPLLNSQRSLKGKADAVLAPLLQAGGTLRGRLNAFMARKAAEAAEARRKAEEAAQRAREAAAASAQPDEPPPLIEPAKVEAPVARGDLGARVGTVTRWHHEIESVRQLPDRILKNVRVIEALDKVIGAEIRGGCRELKGTRIWSTQEAAVR